MSSARALACAGVLLALATVCGAFGAHALRGHLSPERLQLWETAVRYQFLQSLGLLGVGLAMRLYALALGGPRLVGVLTPLGGLAWIVAWVVFAWAAWR